MGGSVFISYRRGADGGFAGRLYDRLERTFRRQRLFMDVDSIAPGEDFVAILEARVAECDVVLALIGRSWLGATDAAGRRRLDNPDDFVRIEVASGLAHGKRVVPVLIDDAPMPGADKLPDDLKSLARRHALPLSHTRFKADADRLVRALKLAFADAEKARQAVEAPPRTEAEGCDIPPPGEDENPLPRGEGGAKAPGEGTPSTIPHSGADLVAALTSRPKISPEPRAPDPAPSPSRFAGPSLSRGERESPPASSLSLRERGGVRGPDDLPDLAVFRDIDAPWCPEMVMLPIGEFLMGSPKNDKWGNRGQHRVTIGTRFAMGRYPLTFEEYDHFCAAMRREKAGDAGWGRGRRPVINVSWRDAVSFCEWLSHETGQSYRLPSEAEWEYGCRAGTTTRYAFGDEIGEKDANFGKKIGKTTEVGKYPPNPWGLYDMHGNVWEWVEDVWHEGYMGGKADGSAWTDGEGKDSSNFRVFRGGSWNSEPWSTRSADRGKVVLGDPVSLLGFRVARTLE